MELPSEPQIRWILRTTASLLQAGAEPVRGLVQPTGAYFPDAFDGSPASVAALFRRIQAHAGLTDLEAEINVAAPDGSVQKASCGTGGCGGGGAIDAKLDRVARRSDGSYVIAVGAGEVRHSTALTTALTRAMSLMFLIESGAAETIAARDVDATVDLTGTLLGFGVLLTNGSHIYSKACSGVHVQSATKMGVEELGLALGIFCELHEIPERVAQKHLELTPREAFEEGSVWAASNRKIVKMLRSDPEAIADDQYSIAESRSWLARALGIGKKKTSTPEEELAQIEKWVAAPAAKKVIDPAKAARLAEIRALMEETTES
ncbi:MAG: hypothetical protein U0441_21655 [Polyangiaceae bacterium]